MATSTTSIAELPASNTSQQIQKIPIPTNQNIQEPEQRGPISTQQISNEFYGHISGQTQYPQTNDQMEGNLNYKPMNVHPNPYGTPQVTPDGIPLPESSPQRNQNQTYSVENIPQQQLPSRDIPMNTLEYQQDSEIKPNHVPSVKLTSDYIRDYEKANSEELKLHREKKYRQEASQETISEFQIPLLVSVLYFLFSMPIVSTFMLKHLTFLKIYNEDGNFNIVGLLFKSILFGTLLYAMQSVSSKISEL